MSKTEMSSKPGATSTSSANETSLQGASFVRHDQNARTQPYKPGRVFGNWDVIAKGWYAACPIDDLRRGSVKPFELYGQRLVLFRGDDGKARALDAFCPHMGTDLAIGTVVGNSLQCFFHHWRFGGDGACVDIPCQKGGRTPARASLASYATCEKYGYVWVWPEATAPEPVADFEGLEGEDLVYAFGEPFDRTCHHHVCMINGLDPQHLATVHDIHVTMDVQIAEGSNGRIVDFVLEGEIPNSLPGRALQEAIGDRYRYGMRYADGCVGLLTTMKGLRLGGRGPKLPELHMVFAYTPIARGRIRVQPIFVTKRRKGVAGYLLSETLLAATKQGFHALQSEDGKVYDNMRFSPNALLAMDAPVAKFIGYVNRLEGSVWSREMPSPSVRHDAKVA